MLIVLKGLELSSVYHSETVLPLVRDVHQRLAYRRHLGITFGLPFLNAQISDVLSCDAQKGICVHLLTNPWLLHAHFNSGQVDTPECDKKKTSTALTRASYCNPRGTPGRAAGTARSLQALQRGDGALALAGCTTAGS